MKKYNNINVKDKINRFHISQESKKKLMFFYECIERNKKEQSNYNINIIIDNMPIEMINKHVDYIKKILLYSNHTLKINKYDDSAKDLKNSLVLINMDDDLLWKMYDSGKHIKTTISQCVKNNNIIIITSVKSLRAYESFRQFDVFSTLPCISFGNSFDEKYEYNSLVKKYKNCNINCKINKDEFHEIVSCIKDDDYIRNFNISDYLYDYSIKRYTSEKNKTISIKTFEPIICNKTNAKNNNKMIDINKIIGLSSVKNELNSLFSYAEFIKKNHLNCDDIYLNMFFLGNPGTGKTMVADIVANNLYKMGYLEKNDVVKIIPTDLLGEYVGQTRKKVREQLEKAKGKLLFIDEAYLLYNDGYKEGNNPFMQEAIVELLKYLEDPKNITIMAGYYNEMQKIYKTNPGIKSRIYKEIIFDDYSVNELYKILSQDLRQKGLTINKNDRNDIKEHIKEIKNDNTFGNARTIKQLAQSLIINHATNNNNNLIITKDDIPKNKKEINRKKYGIGFGE